MTPNSARTKRRRLLHTRWLSLPSPLRTEQQVAGRGAIACGATWGVMEKCNFECTSCYLTELGNHAKPIPFDQVASQLATLRERLGHGAKVQITSGEVTLLSVEALGRIVAHAIAIGLDPMVMSNGERFRQDEDYLVRLVRDYGLRKLSLHIDSTQAGRRWSPTDVTAPMPPSLRERDLNPLRDQFADLIERTRARASQGLHVAHTVTVTPRTLEDVSDIVDWFLHRPTFRLLSFLPVAAVGRTEDATDPQMTMDAVWSRVERGVGRSLNRDGMQFGHRECNITVPLLVIAARDRISRVVEVVRRDSAWDRRVFQRILATLAMSLDLNRGLVHNAIRAAWVAFRHPWFGLEFAAWLASRVPSIAMSCSRLLASGRWPRFRPVFVVVHKFMNADELDTPLGRERLDGCVLKLPMPDGELISMCEMNASALRHDLNLESMSRRSARTYA